MASKAVALPVTRRGLSTLHSPIPIVARAFSHFPPARRRYLFQSRPKPLSTGTRAFSASPLRPLAAVDDTFDPRQQDRESDEVDVCIVGGGIALYFEF